MMMNGGGDAYDIDHFDEDGDVGCMFVMMMNDGDDDECWQRRGNDDWQQ